MATAWALAAARRRVAPVAVAVARRASPTPAAALQAPRAPPRRGARPALAPALLTPRTPSLGGVSPRAAALLGPRARPLWLGAGARGRLLPTPLSALRALRFYKAGHVEGDKSRHAAGKDEEPASEPIGDDAQHVDDEARSNSVPKSRADAVKDAAHKVPGDEVPGGADGAGEVPGDEVPGDAEAAKATNDFQKILEMLERHSELQRTGRITQTVVISLVMACQLLVIAVIAVVYGLSFAVEQAHEKVSELEE